MPTTISSEEAAEQDEGVHQRASLRRLVVEASTTARCVCAPKTHALDHEQQRDQRAPSGIGSVGHAHRQPGQFGDRSGPWSPCTAACRTRRRTGRPAAISTSHQRAASARCSAAGRRSVSMVTAMCAAGAVGRGRADEGEHHHQQDRDRLRPLRAGAQHVAREHAPGNDQRHQRRWRRRRSRCRPGRASSRRRARVHAGRSASRRRAAVAGLATLT